MPARITHALTMSVTVSIDASIETAMLFSFDGEIGDGNNQENDHQTVIANRMQSSHVNIRATTISTLERADRRGELWLASHGEWLWLALFFLSLVWHSCDLTLMHSWWRIQSMTISEIKSSNPRQQLVFNNACKQFDQPTWMLLLFLGCLQRSNNNNPSSCSGFSRFLASSQVEINKRGNAISLMNHGSPPSLYQYSWCCLILQQ